MLDAEELYIGQGGCKLGFDALEVVRPLKGFILGW